MQKNSLRRIKRKKKQLILNLKDKIPQEKGIKITDAIRELKDVLNKDVDQIKPKLDALKSLVNEITTELYKNASPPPGAGHQAGEGEQQTTNEEQQTTNEEQPTGEQKSESTSEEKSSKNTNSN